MKHLGLTVSCIARLLNAPQNRRGGGLHKRNAPCFQLCSDLLEKNIQNDYHTHHGFRWCRSLFYFPMSSYILFINCHNALMHYKTPLCVSKPNKTVRKCAHSQSEHNSKSNVCRTVTISRSFKWHVPTKFMITGE